MQNMKENEVSGDYILDLLAASLPCIEGTTEQVYVHVMCHERTKYFFTKKKKKKERTKYLKIVFRIE